MPSLCRLYLYLQPLLPPLLPVPFCLLPAPFTYRSLPFIPTACYTYNQFQFWFYQFSSYLLLPTALILRLVHSPVTPVCPSSTHLPQFVWFHFLLCVRFCLYLHTPPYPSYVHPTLPTFTPAVRLLLVHLPQPSSTYLPTPVRSAPPVPRSVPQLPPIPSSRSRYASLVAPFCSHPQLLQFPASSSFPDYP